MERPDEWTGGGAGLFLWISAQGKIFTSNQLLIASLCWKGVWFDGGGDESQHCIKFIAILLKFMIMKRDSVCKYSVIHFNTILSWVVEYYQRHKTYSVKKDMCNVFFFLIFRIWCIYPCKMNMIVIVVLYLYCMLSLFYRHTYSLVKMKTTKCLKRCTTL